MKYATLTDLDHDELAENLHELADHVGENGIKSIDAQVEGDMKGPMTLDLRLSTALTKDHSNLFNIIELMEDEDE